MSYTQNLLALLFCLAFQPAVLTGQDLLQPKNCMTVVAHSGDDVPLLLQRYGLSDFSCNITQFFKINKLREDYRLKNGATYKLPLWVVPYNGKSIRTTLQLDSWKTAKQIETFNKDALKSGLRSDNFLESKKLWVPFHVITCDETDVPAISTKPGQVKTGI